MNQALFYVAYYFYPKGNEQRFAHNLIYSFTTLSTAEIAQAIMIHSKVGLDAISISFIRQIDKQTFISLGGFASADITKNLWC